MQPSLLPAEPPPNPPELLRKLARCGELLSARLGLRREPGQAALARALAELSPALGGGDLAACLDRLLAAPIDTALLDAIAARLVDGESYFFRNPGTFAALAEEILPALLAGRSDPALRLWSAGCAGGEEAYSIAIVLDRALPEAWRRQASLLATDIDAAALARAALGVYGEEALRGVAPDVRERHFEPAAAGSWRIQPRLRDGLRFARLNLAEDPFPDAATGTEGLDLIFCCNVLRHFDPGRARAVAAQLARCLAPGGWLVVSAVEAGLLDGIGLQPHYRHDVILFRRPMQPPALAQVQAAAAEAGRLARSLARQGRLAEALAWSERAAAADAGNPAWPYLRATILLEQGRTAAATAALRRTLFLNHACPLGHYALGRLFASQRRRHEARRHYRLALSILADWPGNRPLPEAEEVSAEGLRQTLQRLLAEAA